MKKVVAIFLTTLYACTVFAFSGSSCYVCGVTGDEKIATSVEMTATAAEDVPNRSLHGVQHAGISFLHLAQRHGVVFHLPVFNSVVKHFPAHKSRLMASSSAAVRDSGIAFYKLHCVYRL